MVIDRETLEEFAQTFEVESKRVEATSKLVTCAMVLGAAVGFCVGLVIGALLWRASRVPAPAPVKPVLLQTVVVCDPTRARTGADARAVCAMFDAARR